MNALHFCPKDGWFGDPMPVWYEGVYHLYYTKLYHAENRNLGWGHLVTRDLIHYEERPDPFAESDPGAPINTGCVFPWKGVFHAYYYGKTPTGEAAIFHAASDDPDSFTYQGDICFTRPDFYRQDDTWRDPFVFRDEKSGVFRMVFCAKAPDDGSHDNGAGVIAQAVSEDLRHWKCLPPLPLYGVAGHPECPQLFQVGNRIGLSYFWKENRFRTAETIQGPWEASRIASPDGSDFTAPRLMQDGERTILCGWLPQQAIDAGDRGWGGYYLIPRELTFPDGHTPHTRFIREIYRMFPHKGSFKPDNALLCGKGWRREGERLVADTPCGGCMAIWRDMPSCCLIRATVTFTGPGSLFWEIAMHDGLLGAEQDLEDGYCLELNAGEGVARLFRHRYYHGYPYLVTVPLPVEPGKPLSVELVRNGDILEIGLGERRTMVTRLAENERGAFCIRAMDTVATVDEFALFLPD